MNAKVEVQAGRLDGLKFAVALLLVVAAVGGYYYFEDQSQLLRVIGILVVFGVATAVVLQTERGRGVYRFAKDARTEVRKVVWPTRVETTQTTLIVIAMVIVMSLILWGFDSVLTWAVRFFTGQGV